MLSTGDEEGTKQDCRRRRIRGGEGLPCPRFRRPTKHATALTWDLHVFCCPNDALLPYGHMWEVFGKNRMHHPQDTRIRFCTM